jgi:hypothetical protein
MRCLWILIRTDFRETYSLNHQSEENQRARNNIISFVVTSSLFIFIRIMVAISSCETSVVTRATLRHILEDDMLYSNRLEVLKYFIGHLALFWNGRRTCRPVQYGWRCLMYDVCRSSLVPAIFTIKCCLYVCLKQMSLWCSRKNCAWPEYSVIAA